MTAWVRVEEKLDQGRRAPDCSFNRKWVGYAGDGIEPVRGDDAAAAAELVKRVKKRVTFNDVV